MLTIVIISIIVVWFATLVYTLSSNIRIKHVLYLTRSYCRLQVVILEKIEKSNAYYTIFKLD